MTKHLKKRQQFRIVIGHTKFDAHKNSFLCTQQFVQPF